MNIQIPVLIGLLCLATAGKAEVAIIAHPSINETVSLDDLNRIFLGKAKALSSGHKIIPLNLVEGNATRKEFNNKVLRKTDSQLKAYWSKLIFTGKGQPPKELASVNEIKS
jgi:hypothetical protein